MKTTVCFLFALLLFASLQALAAEKTKEEQTHFSVTVPGGWFSYSGKDTQYVPDSVKKAFDGTDYEQPELYMIGWRESQGEFLGAFAITYVHKGTGNFLKQVLEGDPAQKEKAAVSFSDLEALRIRKAYVNDRKQKVVESSVDFLESGDMFVAVSDAIIDAGKVKRTRSATYFFRGDSMIGVITLRNEKAPEKIVKDLDNLPMAVIWND